MEQASSEIQGDEFTFPVLGQEEQKQQVQEKPPLTAKSTVVLAKKDQMTNSRSSPQPVIQPPKAPRQGKIPLEKGYSQMDWMRLTRTNNDLAGLNGGSLRKGIPMEEVRQHHTEQDGWMVVRGKVYNIIPYMKFHPGGDKILKPMLGRDATSLFNKYHPWVNVDALLEKCLIGYVDQNKPEDYL
eukprot:TRINITY_DN5153_c0_g1_i3.p2 TRINITY_DN5153_c0_g1~~TRINITY_DN5153_c0_g1_i3.p2  ORF type:complete len:184 (+),score=22.36 TRINITY_DN5153_c0_g1_i3:163-714(+)